MIHKPVLLEPILNYLQDKSINPKFIVDATFGRGGHSLALLENYPDARVFAFDRDQEAIDYGLESYSSEVANQRLQLLRANFVEVNDHVQDIESFFASSRPDLVLLDLGVSSPQLDVAERGFSFYHSGPLDMRMDMSQELTAHEIINTWEEQELSDLFYHLGEIRFPNKVVRSICANRKAKPIETTEELSELIARADGWRKKGKHPATQYFLALRLRVNEELDNITKALSNFLDLLAPNGLLMVISFHSTEDRIVKRQFKSFVERGTIITKKVIQAERLEIKDNPRARSAKLRIFQKGE